MMSDSSGIHNCFIVIFKANPPLQLSVRKQKWLMWNHFLSTYHPRNTYSVSKYLETPKRRRESAAITWFDTFKSQHCNINKNTVISIHVIKKTIKVSETPKLI